MSFCSHTSLTERSNVWTLVVGSEVCGYLYNPPIYSLCNTETHHELMDRFEDFEEMFRDFVTDEGRGDENLIRKYEKEILLQKKTAKNKMIYSA